MLQYLINVTDNTFVSIIIIAFLIAVIYKVNSTIDKKVWIVGFLVGLLVAIIYAILKRNTGFVVREFYDLAIITPLVILFPLTLITMWGCFYHVSYRKIYQPLLLLFCSLNIALISALFMPNILIYPLDFDVGMDSVFNNEYLAKCVGYSIAILVSLVTAIFVYKICIRLSDRFVLCVTSLVLFVFVAQNTINIIQILIVRRFIKYQQWMMDLVLFVLGHVNFFIWWMIAILFCLSITLYIKSKTTSLVGSNPAQIRKLKSELRKDRRRSLLVFAGVAITAYTITRARYIFEKGVELSPAEPVNPNESGLIVIPLEKINDGNLHRFGYESTDSTTVRFIIIKKSENAYGVGLDACDICGASGYYQRGDQVVCILCDVVMNIATIGFPGGCNPVPLKFEIIDGQMVIRSAHLEAEKYRFK